MFTSTVPKQNKTKIDLLGKLDIPALLKESYENLIVSAVHAVHKPKIKCSNLIMMLFCCQRNYPIKFCVQCGYKKIRTKSTGMRKL